LLKLKDNWDSYGGQKISEDAVEWAIAHVVPHLDLVSIPEVIPTSRGGFQFEWHLFGVDAVIEVLPYPISVRTYFSDNTAVGRARIAVAVGNIHDLYEEDA
jgi:hypothetical protein